MKINIYFCIVFIMAMIAFITDIILYIIGGKYLMSLIISALIVINIFVYWIKKQKIEITIDFEKTDVFLFIGMFFITIFSGIVYPDFVYDTISYHEYLQKNPFMDKVNYDFFPGRIYCMGLFPVGDRMYYIIRYFFGYRFGATLSFFSTIVIFYQVKNILKILTNNSKMSSIITYGIFLLMSYSIYVGTYYIDNICVLFTLQILYIILSNNDLFQCKSKLRLIALISGIAIGIKITQIFFIVPLLIYMLIKNIKDIKNVNLLDIIQCFILAILPYIVYLIDNYMQTGNMLFPYYNAIFKSEYFGDYNWIDERFTLNGLINYLFWPVIEGFNYGYYGDEHIFIDPIFGISYICTILYIVYCFIKRKRDIKFQISILAMACYVIWIITMKGYFRYGFFVGILCCLVLYAIIVEWLGKKKISNFYSFPLYISIIVTEVFLGFYILIIGCDFENGKYIFKDTDKKEYKIEIDGVWGAPKDCCAYVSLVRKEGTPIYNLHREYFSDKETTLKMWEDRIKNNDIYTIIDYYGGDFENCYLVKKLKEDGFEIEEIVEVYNVNEIPYMNANSVWCLVKLKYNQIN